MKIVRGIPRIYFLCSAELRVIATLQLIDHATMVHDRDIERTINENELDKWIGISTEISFKYLLTFNDNFMIKFYFTGFSFDWYFNWHGDFQHSKEL